MLLVPYEIETLKQYHPWANWLTVGICSLVSLMVFGGMISEDVFESLVLDGWGLKGLLGHVLLHGDLIHLIGNMIFLWVFGNAVCTNIGNLKYLAVFLGCTLVAAFFHNVFDGGPAIGASGAINGIVGLVLAMYPLNRVYVFWFFVIKGGTFSVRAWHIILFWLAFDIWGAVMGGGMIAYWAHIGGLAGGIGIGILCLRLGWIQLTQFDNRSLLDIFTGHHPDDGF